MLPVNDLEHFSQLTANRGSSLNWGFTNCYLLPGLIRIYTQKGKLRYQQVENGILIFCEETDFEYLYFYLNDPLLPLQDFPSGYLEKPLVIDLVYVGEILPHKILEIQEYWISQGFHHHLSYRHMVCSNPARGGHVEVREAQSGLGFKVDTVRSELFESIHRLFRTSLDLFSSALPGIEEMKVLAQQGNLLCVMDQSGNLAGAVVIDKNGKTSTVKHLVIAPEYRTRGLADFLVKEYIARFPDLQTFDLWVKDDNIPAIKLYQNNGYQFDGKRIDQLLMPLRGHF